MEFDPGLSPGHGPKLESIWYKHHCDSVLTCVAGFDLRSNYGSRFEKGILIFFLGNIVVHSKRYTAGSIPDHGLKVRRSPTRRKGLYLQVNFRLNTGLS